MTRLLVVSPHADDAELGCGGYMAWVHRTGGQVLNVVVAVGDVFFAHLGRTVSYAERISELDASMQVLGAERFICFAEHDSRLDTVPLVDIVLRLEHQIRTFEPTEILIPLPSSHQDHEASYRACLAACRPSARTATVQLIAAYEYPATSWGAGSAADAGKGGLYVEIGESGLEAKLKALRCYRSQIRAEAHCWSLTAATVMARMRGIEAGLHHAELFHVMRQIRQQGG
jgi:LmbE family N-acetylglucosaminyl deacetylase